MRSQDRKNGGNGIFRGILVGISLLLQIGWLLLIIVKLNRYSAYISLITGLIAAAAVIRLYSRDTNGAYKMPWIMLIMALPVMGLSLYLMAELLGSPPWIRKRVENARKASEKYLAQESPTEEKLRQTDASAANQMRCLYRQTGYPVCCNTETRYYDFAGKCFEEMKHDLERAERFIFMEYFIVEDDRAFSEILDILVRKVRQGVQVRLMYDDVGSIGYVNLKFAEKLNQLGIRCRAFNPALPVVNLFMNHRDHRKITVIDGKIGYTGGFNLANAYFGYDTPFGTWKDTGLRLEGEAVRSLSATFLELWNLHSPLPEEDAQFLSVGHSVPAEGFVQPYGDDPMSGERAAENMYLNLISGSRKYVWFMTPYLMITDEMCRALCLAAEKGVDVRIVTPGIPDKEIVYRITRSYYAALAKKGVRIYEYTPGFCHGKQCLCDGEIGSIGTSNLDYRSLYLHFENNVLLYGCPALKEMERDFLETFRQCREVTGEYRGGRRGTLRLWQCLLRLFAPIL